jgi:SAM-dependent methyltransferase
MQTTHKKSLSQRILHTLIELQEEQRTPNQVKEHYLVEKELAHKLRVSSREERKVLYTSLYDELYQRVPANPQLTLHTPAQAGEETESPQIRFLRRFLRKDAVVLEIGAGTCDTALAITRDVREVYALEVSEEITRSTRGPENFACLLFDGFDIPLRAGSIDVAYSDQVLEHIHPDDALEHMTNVYNVLVDGGSYICITPNGLCGPHDISKYFDLVATGFHLKEYTNTELYRLFRRAGFAKVKAYIGIPALYVRYPLVLLVVQEALLSRLPRKLSRALARLTLSWNIRMVGLKQRSNTSARRKK